MVRYVFILSVFTGILLVSCTSSKLPKVVFVTPLGNIVIEADTLNAPITAKNFLKHVNAGTFSEAMFYRTVRHDNQSAASVKIEVIQGGLFADSLIDRFPAIVHEHTALTGLSHKNGVVSMARNEPGTASTEFFICVGNQPELDYGGKRNLDGMGFAAFAKVVQGMKTVRRIHRLPENKQYLVEPVNIEKVIIKK